MDRNERKPILEPFMLILKQRTGVATLLGIILALVLYIMGFPDEVVNGVVALVFVYVGGQKWVDAKEASAPVIEFKESLEDELDKVKEVVE